MSGTDDPTHIYWDLENRKGLWARGEAMSETPQEYPNIWEAEREVLRAEVERLRGLTSKVDYDMYLKARAEKAEAALRQIAAWSWDSGSTPAPEVVSRIYCEARAVLRDSAPGEKP